MEGYPMTILGFGSSGGGPDDIPIMKFLSP